MPTRRQPGPAFIQVIGDHVEVKEIPAVRRHTLILKTAVVSIVVIGANVAGNYALKRGLRHVGVVETWSLLPYIRAFMHRWVALGVAFMVCWTFSRLALLSWADLTYVLPVTSASYVLTALAGALLLNERVTPLHWVGIAVITTGVAFVATTFPRTTGNSELEE
jgi:drug/metabolite transporter (DMT)-like permease